MNVKDMAVADDLPKDGMEWDGTGRAFREEGEGEGEGEKGRGQKWAEESRACTRYGAHARRQASSGRRAAGRK